MNQAGELTNHEQVTKCDEKSFLINFLHSTRQKRKSVETILYPLKFTCKGKLFSHSTVNPLIWPLPIFSLRDSSKLTVERLTFSFVMLLQLDNNKRKGFVLRQIKLCFKGLIKS